MKKLYRQAVQIAVEAQMIADNLEEHNPGLCKNKTPLEVIQCDVGCLEREVGDLYGKIGGKIRDVDDL